MTGREEPSSAPVIPAPPPRGRSGAARRRRRSARAPTWALALVLGTVAGALSHRYLPAVAEVIDYWVALALA